MRSDRKIILSTLSTSLEEGLPKASVKTRLYSPFRRNRPRNRSMKLFSEDTCSPFFRSSPREWNLTAEEFQAVITPYGKTSRSLFVDEDSGIGMEYDLMMPDNLRCLSSTKEDLNGSYNEPQFQLHRRRINNHRQSLADAKKSLFSNKRQAEDDIEDLSPSTKKLRDNDSEVEHFAMESPAAGIQSIIQAVDKLSTKEELVADGSRDYSLPTIPGKHSDLKTISAAMMAQVVEGRFSKNLQKVSIIDCRYPYEFEGGHIKGALNLYTKDSVNILLEEPLTPGQTHVLIFHCEFSSERGPKMYRFLRSQDRNLNKDRYPALNYPEIYLLEGGYKTFYQSHPELCDPTDYKPMLHEDHTEDLKHFRIKSKSWNGDKKAQKPKFSRHRSCLAF